MTADRQPENSNPSQPSLWARLSGRLPRGLKGLGGIALVAVFALLIVFVMRNFSGDVQASQQADLRATAEALAQPMIESINGGAAGELMPSYSGAGGAYSNGIQRRAELDTTIPTRARVDITTYEVKQGDTLFAIADNYGLKPETILWGNYDTLQDNPNQLTPGQVLNILPTDGVLHKYSAGEDLTAIAEFYETTPEAIVEWPGNHLDPYETDYANPGLEDGTALIVPGGQRELQDWGPPAISRDNPAVAAYYGPGSCGAIDSGAVGSGVFVWPTVATYLSGNPYDANIHPAIDIAGAEGNAIYAADSGVVVYAGWSNFGYGNLLVIDHGNGWQTAYAHLYSIGVYCGQSVSRGEVVAALGTTGNSTGPHLHFEMRSEIYGKVNPYNFVSP